MCMFKVKERILINILHDFSVFWWINYFLKFKLSYYLRTDYWGFGVHIFQNNNCSEMKLTVVVFIWRFYALCFFKKKYIFYVLKHELLIVLLLHKMKNQNKFYSYSNCMLKRQRSTLIWYEINLMTQRLTFTLFLPKISTHLSTVI
jgi:hypothetical protein